MRQRTKLIAGSLAGAVAIHLALLACGTMRAADDAGRLLDAETPEAAAQDSGGGATVLQAACDQMSVQTTTQAGSSSESTIWYAEVAVPGLDPTRAPRVSAVLCDREMFGTAGCQASVGCVQTGYTPPADACSQGLPQLAAGRLIIVCGSRSVSTVGTTRTEAGARARRVYVRVD